MKIYSCMVFALLVFLVSYSLAVETSQKATDKVEPAAGGGGGNWGGGGGGGNWGGGGYGCRYGCCYRGRYSCQQCCRSPEEAMAVEASQKATDKVEPAGGGGGGGNWGGGGGGGGHGGCRHGCCSHGHYGCQQCCHSPEEAKAFADKQAHP